MFPQTKKFSVYVLFVLIVVLPLSGFVFTTSAQVPTDPPIHIHLTWQNDTSTTITVTWQTSSSTSGDNVLYDNVSRGGVPDDYPYNATGINYTYSGASGYIHDVELTGLTPDTVYYFICGGNTGGWSSERAFCTAPSVSSDVRFVAGGDSRTNVAEREKISQAMAKFNPSFVIHTGDMVYNGCVQSGADGWDTWFTDVNDHWICNNSELDNYGLTIPGMVIEGNHENPTASDTKYYNQFALPRVPSDSHGERWFSLDWGPDIHITFLTTEWSYPPEQDAWLEADLAAHENVTWKIVAFHKPPFPGASGRYGEAVIRERWCPLFDKYHVDIVIMGHDHMYLRTCPINMSTYVQPPGSGTPAPIGGGTVYVISGGWGAPLYTPGQHWYDAYVESTYHFCLVDVFKNGSLHLQAKYDTGETFDEFWIIKNETESPTIEIPSRIPEGDILPDQPVKVSVNVTDVLSGVKNVTLSYAINDGPWTDLLMNYNYSAHLYEATIPGQPAGTWVKFKIVAYDYAGNNATKDGTEPYCAYQVIPEFPSAIILPLLMALTIIAVILAKRSLPRKPKQ